MDQKVSTKLRDINLHFFRQSSPNDDYFKDIEIATTTDIKTLLEEGPILDDEASPLRPLEFQLGAFEEEEKAPADLPATFSDKRMRQN